MEPTDGIVARACQKALDRPGESRAVALFGGGLLLLSQTPWGLGALLLGLPAWPWLLVGHLGLGALVLSFVLFEPPGAEEGWSPHGDSAPQGPPGPRARLVDAAILALVLLLGGLLPAVALLAGLLGGLHHLAGCLLLAPVGAACPARLRLRDGVLEAEGHMPGHVRLALATGEGLRSRALRCLAGRAGAVLHVGSWGAVLSVEKWILLARGLPPRT